MQTACSWAFIEPTFAHNTNMKVLQGFRKKSVLYRAFGSNPRKGIIESTPAPSTTMQTTIVASGAKLSP